MADTNVARVDAEEKPIEGENQDVEKGTTSENEVENENKETEKQNLRKENEDETGVANDVKERDTKNGRDSKEKYDYTASLMHSSIYHDNEIVVNPEIIEQLTNGLVEQFIPSLRKTQTTIAQIKDSQQVLIDTVEQENSKFNECRSISRLESTMAKAKIYQNKLLKLRKEMTSLHEKSAKLKRRAVKLQQHKQKEEMNRAAMLEKEFEREKMLIARVATEPHDS